MDINQPMNYGLNNNSDKSSLNYNINSSNLIKLYNTSKLNNYNNNSNSIQSKLNNFLPKGIESLIKIEDLTSFEIKQYNTQLQKYSKGSALDYLV